MDHESSIENKTDDSKLPLHQEKGAQTSAASTVADNSRKRSRDVSQFSERNDGADNEFHSFAESSDGESIENEDNSAEMVEDEAALGPSSETSFPSSLLAQFGTQLTWDDSTNGIDATVTFPCSDHPPSSNEGSSSSNDYSQVRLCLVGRARITCLGDGDVEVGGYRLSSSSSSPMNGNMDRDNSGDGTSKEYQVSLEVASPSWSSYITVTQISPTLLTRIQVCSIRPCQDGSANGNGDNLYNSDTHQQLSHPTFQLLHPTHPMARPTIIPSTWQRSVEQIEQDLRQQKEQNERQKTSNSVVNGTGGRQRSRIVLCGGKGVGKSTCLRYSVNRLLSSQSCTVGKVAIIDADVGQPELSPPGILSLSIVSSPLVHPPYMNLIHQSEKEDDSVSGFNPSNQHRPSDRATASPTAVSSIFFGAITSKVDPTIYIECIQYLISQYEQNVASDGAEYDIPLFINLDGWVKGIGYEILSALLTNSDGIDPTHIIQLVGETRAKMFDLTEIVGSTSTATSAPSLYVVDAFNNSNVGLAGVDMTGRVEQHGGKGNASESIMAGSSSSVPSSSLRAIRFGSYFVPDQELWDKLVLLDSFVDRLQHGWRDDNCEIAHCLASERPYCVPFEAVQYCLIGSDRQDVVSDDMILKVLNASIVGLCYDRSSSVVAVGNQKSEVEGEPIFQDSNDTAPQDNVKNPCTASGGLRKPLHLLECLGLGLIRAIDIERQLFYILTPVPSTKLRKVQTLVCGNLEVPLQFHFRGVHAESFPYMKINDHRKHHPHRQGGEGDRSEESNIYNHKPIGSDPMQSRNNIARLNNNRN